jgi:hypothetical protein
MGVFCLFHPPAKIDFPPFVDDFHPKTEVTLDHETFVSTSAHSPHLFPNVFSGMMYELLQDCFVLDDYANAFDLFFKVCGHIARGRVPPLIQRLLSTFRFLALEK